MSEFDRPDPSVVAGGLPSVAEMRRICQDPVRGGALRHDPLYRWASIYLTRQAVRARLTPHGVTALSLLAGLGAAAALQSLSPTRIALAAVLLQVYFVLDYVDGEVARYRGMASLGGRFLEQAGCSAVDPFLLLGLGIGLQRATGWAAWRELSIAGALSLVYFRMGPPLINATLTNLYMAVRHRDAGDATPEPGEPGALQGLLPRLLLGVYPVYRRFRFPYFHPNLVILLSLSLGTDFFVTLLGRIPVALPVALFFFGVATPVWALWQALNILQLRVCEERWRAIYVEGRAVREEV